MPNCQCHALHLEIHLSCLLIPGEFNISVPSTRLCFELVLVLEPLSVAVERWFYDFFFADVARFVWTATIKSLVQ
jgi:hypothetical protein